MLVLTRKVGEAIYVGEDIVIRVNRIERNRVRLEINAPRQVRILREELVSGSTTVELLPLGSAPEGMDEDPNNTPNRCEPTEGVALDPDFLLGVEIFP